MSGETKQRLSDLEIENAKLRQQLLDRPTLRDQFAMAALTGLLSNSKLANKFMDENGRKNNMWEYHAYGYADEMMKARHVKN